MCPTFGWIEKCLRENPDIIFVGEIRDTETASLALSATETGHLVFHTAITAMPKGLSRIVDMFPAEQTKSLCLQLSFSLSYVLSQKLVPVLMEMVGFWQWSSEKCPCIGKSDPYR